MKEHVVNLVITFHSGGIQSHVLVMVANEAEGNMVAKQLSQELVEHLDSPLIGMLGISKMQLSVGEVPVFTRLSVVQNVPPRVIL